MSFLKLLVLNSKVIAINGAPNLPLGVANKSKGEIINI